MGQDSKIEWCDDTVNFWWGPNGDRRLRVENALRDLRKLARLAEKEGHKRTVFMQSMSDTFEDRADLDEPREAALRGLREMGPDCGLIPLLLTKRPDRMAAWADANGWPEWWCAGATVEDQERADERIPHLLRVPAAVRFLSCEPLLGRVRLTIRGADVPGWDEDWRHNALTGDGWAHPHSGSTAGGDRIHWVIAGGESGGKARPSHPDWFRRLRDDCVAAAVPFFFTQWGEWAPVQLPWDADYEATAEPSGMPHWEEGGGVAAMLRVGEKAAGAMLDGLERKQTPWGRGA